MFKRVIVLVFGVVVVACSSALTLKAAIGVGAWDALAQTGSLVTGIELSLIHISLARTMVMKPKILLLDEPLSALDGVIKESIKERIKIIAKEYNLTTIIVTHDPEEALTLSDQVLIINEGKISQFGKPEEIINHPSCDFVQDFILNQLEIKRRNIMTLFSPVV